MSTYKAIADDYYINGLNNSAIFEKHCLQRQKQNINQERVYEHLPAYKHSTVSCTHCGGEIESSYLSKSSNLATNTLDIKTVGKEIEEIALVRIDNREGRRFNLRNRGKAFLVDGGHKVSIPGCVLCGHRLQEQCQCNACIAFLNSRITRAAALTLKELTEIEPLKPIELTATELLSLFKQLSTFMENVTRLNSKTAFAMLEFEEKTTLMMLGLASPSVDSIRSAVTMVSRKEYFIDWDSIDYEVIKNVDLTGSLSKLKIKARNLIRTDIGAISVLDLWESLAESEAIGVLQHYCDVHDICCTPGEQTRTAIKRSLTRYGLALTARYIYNAVWNARKYSSEKGFDRHRAFTFIYGNLNFWIEDPRAREYSAPPFSRTEQVLSEPSNVSIFAQYFMEPNSVNYFTDPVSLASYRCYGTTPVDLP